MGSNFHKIKPIVTKFSYVFKLFRFALYAKISHHVAHTFFTGMRQKFEHVINCSSSDVRNPYEFSICFTAENMLRIFIISCKDFSRTTFKLSAHYHFFFHQILASTMKFGYHNKVQRVALYIKNCYCITSTLLHRCIKSLNDL